MIQCTERRNGVHSTALSCDLSADPVSTNRDVSVQYLVQTSKISFLPLFNQLKCIYNTNMS